MTYLKEQFGSVGKTVGRGEYLFASLDHMTGGGAAAFATLEAYAKEHPGEARLSAYIDREKNQSPAPVASGPSAPHK